MVSAHVISPDRTLLQPYLGLLRLILQAVSKLPQVSRVTVYRGTHRRLEDLCLPPPGTPVGLSKGKNISPCVCVCVCVCV